jgi:hypothetical protein
METSNHTNNSSQEKTYMSYPLRESNNINEFERKLEKDGMEKCVKLLKSSKPNMDISKEFIKIINEGASEYKKQTGETMSYQKMRELYG